MWKILTYSSTFEQECSRWVILDYLPSVLLLLLFIQFLPSTHKHGFISWSNYIVECYRLNEIFKFRYKYLSFFERSFYAISLLRKNYIRTSFMALQNGVHWRSNIYDSNGKILAFPYPKDNHLLYLSASISKDEIHLLLMLTLVSFKYNSVLDCLSHILYHPVFCRHSKHYTNLFQTFQN